LPWRCSALSTWLISTSWSSWLKCEVATTLLRTASRLLIEASWLFVVLSTEV